MYPRRVRGRDVGSEEEEKVAGSELRLLPFLHSVSALTPEQWFANSLPMVICTERSISVVQLSFHTGTILKMRHGFAEYLCSNVPHVEHAH